jgi:hypothetical protein
LFDFFFLGIGHAKAKSCGHADAMLGLFFGRGSDGKHQSPNG